MQQKISSPAPRSRSGMLSYFSLFTSLSTLLCCALPSLLVLVGLGATVASVVSAVPELVFLSHHKNWVFAIAGVLIASNFLYVYVAAPRLQARSGSCSPDDPTACQTASKLSRIILWCSGVLYIIGFFSAYLLGPLLVKFDS
jgi:hypothetical protein